MFPSFELTGESALLLRVPVCVALTTTFENITFITECAQQVHKFQDYIDSFKHTQSTPPWSLGDVKSHIAALKDILTFGGAVEPATLPEITQPDKD